MHLYDFRLRICMYSFRDFMFNTNMPIVYIHLFICVYTLFSIENLLNRWVVPSTGYGQFCWFLCQTKKNKCSIQRITLNTFFWIHNYFESNICSTLLWVQRLFENIIIMMQKSTKKIRKNF